MPRSNPCCAGCPACEPTPPCPLDVNGTCQLCPRPARPPAGHRGHGGFVSGSAPGGRLFHDRRPECLNAQLRHKRHNELTARSGPAGRPGPPCTGRLDAAHWPYSATPPRAGAARRSYSPACTNVLVACCPVGLVASRSRRGDHINSANAWPARRLTIEATLNLPSSAKAIR
jgi:hypothetical protein